MHFVRASALLSAVLGISIFAAGCSGGGGGATPPVSPDQTISSQGNPGSLDSGTIGASTALSTVSAPASGWNIHVHGPVVAIKSSTEFEINGGAGIGYLNIYTTSTTTKYYNGLTLKTGDYADVYGNGSESTYVTATQVTLSTTSSTSTATPAPTTSTSGVPKHVMTAEYLMGYYGTTKVTPAQAAPHLTWAQTTIADSKAIAAAGIKTQVYVDPNRIANTDPIWGYVSGTSAAFAHTCGGAYVNMSVGSTSLRVTNPSNSTLRSAFQSYTSKAKTDGHVDMIFEDNGGELTPFATYPNGMPCNYTVSSWVSASQSLNQYSSVPVIENGLNLWTSSQISPVLGVVTGSSNTIGGNMEHCYTDNSRTIQYGTAFTQVENTALQTTNHGKFFECMARNTNAAYTQIAARIFTLASFLMTYDVNHSVLAEEFATPSGLRVMPESQLVPTSPVVGQPSSISSLRTASGVYARQYNACYLAGVNKGACVVAVNNDGVSHSFPYSGYTHTLSISGNGILDGGTVSTAGPAPSSTMGPGAAVIAFK